MKRLTQFANEQLGLLERSEMTAFGDIVPIQELRVRSLAPHPRWREHFAFEYAHGNRQIERHSAKIIPEALEVEPRRGCGGVGEPIEADVIEHRVDAQGIFGIAVIVGPSLKLLVDPRPLPDGRVGEAVSQCLRTGPLDRGITRGIGRILAQLSERRLFRGRIPTGWWWWRRKKNRKVQMNSGQPRGLLLGHPTRHTGSPITTLGDVTVVTEPMHQDPPGLGDARKTPPRFGRFVRKAESR